MASYNAGVTVVIVGVANTVVGSRKLFVPDDAGGVTARTVDSINPYLVAGKEIVIEPARRALANQSEMVKGNQPSDGGHLCLSRQEKVELTATSPEANRWVRRYFGAADYLRGKERYCLWIADDEAERAGSIKSISERLCRVAQMRRTAKAPTTRAAHAWPHRFIQIQGVAQSHSIVFPRISSERRDCIPVGLLDKQAILSDQAFALYDAPLWNLSLGTSRLHLVWIATVCGKLKTDYRYSNTLGWNTFPVPTLTEKNKADLTRCAEGILLAREAHFPATIADLYHPEKMPTDLREAHERNDEVLERIYIGRRFRNDTERLEKLFELYTKMIADESQSTRTRKRETRT